MYKAVFKKSQREKSKNGGATLKVATDTWVSGGDPRQGSKKISWGQGLRVDPNTTVKGGKSAQRYNTKKRLQLKRRLHYERGLPRM